MRQKWLDRFLGVTVALAVVGFVMGSVVACDSLFGSDDGGGGADFDSSLYYTKTEVDSQFDAVYLKTESDALIADVFRADVSAGQQITAVDWAGRTSSGFSVPTGATGVLVNIIVNNNSGSPKTLYIQFSSSDAGGDFILQGTVLDTGYTSFFGYATVPTNATVMYGWHDYSGGHSGTSSDLTNVAITVKPVVWLE